MTRLYLRVGGVEQLVDRRVGDALGGGGGAGHGEPPQGCDWRRRAARGGATRRAGARTGPQQGYQPGRSRLDVVVDDDLRRTPPRRRARSRAVSSRRARVASVLGPAAGEPARQLVPRRRRQEDEQGVGHRRRGPAARPAGRSPAAPAPPAASRSLDRRRGRAVAVAGVLGPLEQLAARRPAGRTPRRSTKW